MTVPVQSGFELAVIEGEGQGTVVPLRFTQITLGRYEPQDDTDERVVTFPEPTVSRVHAVMAWDERRGRYLLDHRSRTNHTIVNGTAITRPHVLEAGDRIKMGLLLLECRRAEVVQPPPEPPPRHDDQAATFLVVLSGPDRGKICPLSQPRMALRAPREESDHGPWVMVSGVGEWNVEFIQQDGHLYIECLERPGIVSAWPGLVYDRLAGARERIELGQGSVLMCGDVGLVAADREGAERLSASLTTGAPLGHRVLDGVLPGSPPYWPGHDEYILRLLSGPDRGSTLWIDPVELKEPISLGPSATGAQHVEIPDREAVHATIRFSADGIRLRNADDRGNLNHNWDIVRPGDEVALVSGDRITMGRTMLSFEHVPLQARIESYALYYGDVEMPLVRAVNYIGYRPENELRIDDRRLGPRHGILGVRGREEIYYRHLNPEGSVKIGEDEVTTGQEHPLAPGDRILLTDGIEVRLGERISTHRPSDPVLIGPTQKQLEAEMAARRIDASSASVSEASEA